MAHLDGGAQKICDNRAWYRCWYAYARKPMERVIWR